MNKKVSILIPCYNSEKFLPVTLQCCVSQHYPNIEIIIVDDGSTDQSAKVAEEWSNKYDNIHLYTQPNAGVCRARNLAFEKSTGDYIIYLDADDLISPDLISSQMELLEEADSNAIATCAWGRFYTSIDDFCIDKQSVYRDYKSSSELIEDLLNDGMFGLTCYLTPRSVIMQAGLWNEKLTINTDGEFFIRVLANAGQIRFSNKGYLYYRSNNPNSISRRRPTEAKGDSLLLSYKLIYEYLNAKNMLTPRVKAGLKKAYQSVAYQYAMYSRIVNESKRMAFILRTTTCQTNIGSRPFRFLSQLIGFWNILRIRNLISFRK